VLQRVSRAAVQLQITQPALSRQLRDLESELGLPLFDRVGRRLHLTAEGENLLERTREILRAADALREHAGALAGGATGTLRLGATAQTLESLISAFLTGFRRAWPGIDVRLVAKPTPIAEGLWLSGEMHAAEDWETIPSNLRVEEEGELLQDTFIGEQTLVANVRDRGLVVVTSCSHRGIVGICRNAVRFTGIPTVHAVIGGFHLSGLDDARITRVVDAFRGLDVEHIVPQHCTGFESMATMLQRMPSETVVTSVGSTFTFQA